MHWQERIGRRLKLRDLHILLAVVQWGSMAKASERLALSQPAVSKAIADMEHTLGVRLLDRSRRGVEPTIYGRTIIRRGLAVFDELRQGVKELEVLSDPEAGELRIGSSEGMAAGFLPAVIDRLSRRYPRLVLSISQAVFAAMQYRELRERSIDVLLGRIFTPFEEEDLNAEILFDDQVTIVAGRNSPWARMRRPKLTDLADAPWILPPPGSVPATLASEIFHAEGLQTPRAPVTTLSIHIACKLLATGRFVAMLPNSVLQFGGQELPFKALPIRVPRQQRPVGIVTLKDRTLSPVAQLFIACAREIGGSSVERARPSRSSRSGPAVHEA